MNLGLNKWTQYARACFDNIGIKFEVNCSKQYFT